MSAAALPAPSPDTAEIRTFGEALRGSLDRVRALEHDLQILDDLMLTGRPHAIADAVLAFELSLAEAEIDFSQICRSLSRLGLSGLRDAQRLRQMDPDGAVTAEALGRALKRFARHSIASSRRAQGFSRSLGAALKTLYALGVAEHGRLLAEC